MAIETDILIVGGGIAGCIAAIALADSYQVVLIDKLEKPIERIGECLAPAARRILSQLDLLEGMKPRNESTLHLKNIGTQSYWGTRNVHIVDHLRNPDGFGWHLNRKEFECYLRATALARGVTCIWPSKLYRSYYENSKWEVTTKIEGSSITGGTNQIIAKFVIDASGRQSHFARSQGIKRKHLDKLIACWATLPDREENKMSTISASKEGWWYSAPLPDNRRVLAFQTDSDLIDRQAIKNLDAFLELSQKNEAITKLLARNNGNIDFHGTVAANSTRLDQVVGQQWAALGDAAISFDPLSSQGMFHAMANAMQLTDLIKKFGLITNFKNAKISLFETIYTNQINQIWNHYLKHKAIFYRVEKRWKTAPFWKRRHEMPNL